MADRLFAWLAHGAALLTLGLLLAIMVTSVGGRLAGHQPIRSRVFSPAASGTRVQDQYGGLVMIYGTLATSLIALVIAVPVSFGIALFLTELSPRLAQAPPGHSHRAAGGRALHRVWRGGLMVFGPVLATYVQQPLQVVV